jgi:hypothetical protein
MKKLSRRFYATTFLAVLLAVAAMLPGPYSPPAAHAQAPLRYDDLPDVGEYVLSGRKWDHTNITYFFQNGTADISGDGERQAIRDGFALWSGVSSLTFTEVSNAAFADIVILWTVGDHGDGNPFDGVNGILAHAFYPPPNGGSLAGDAHFDDGESWTLSQRSDSNQPIDLATVAAHEIGHSLGLAHSQEPGALMYPFYSSSHRFLDQDDINGIQFLYPPIQPAMIRFSQSNYSVSETAGDPMSEPVAVITVTRTGNLGGTSTVDYQTIDDPAAVPCDPTAPGGPYPQGKAYARCDYATTIDRLTFAPGESQKSFRIPLVNDSHVEQPETFTIALSNPAGATLGAPASATITINSDDTGSGANPINTHQFFVRQQYLDFLSREPDSGGFNSWLSVLNNCQNPFNTDPNSPSAGCDRIQVSSSFFRSAEFEIKGLYVYKFYRVAFHNPPSSLPAYADISRDLRSVTGQTSQEVFAKRVAFANAFVQRPAFRNAYDGLSNAAYVAALLGPYNLTAITTTDPANPDTGGQVFLTQGDLIARLDNFTLSRAQVLRAVVQSQEVGAVEFNGAFVAMQYYGYLRRTPEESGYNAWLNYLNANPTDFRTMVYGFLYSQEYMLRFGPISSGNLAAGQSAAQSSEGWGGVPSRAVDGNTSGDWNVGSVTHTQVENHAWWQTDLGGARIINSVQLWNRTDCCSERLANFYVLVSDAPFNSTDLQTTLNQPGVSAYYTAGQGGSPTTVVVNRTGRYVRVQLGGSDILSLAEVQVWGR